MSIRNAFQVTPTALLAVVILSTVAHGQSPDEALKSRALDAMRRAATYYHDRVATHGGYVYHYSLDLTRRLGEGKATATQIWVQPPGTPGVGLAYLTAYRATGDRFYLDAAVDAARALVYGQLQSGGWTNSIDFDPQSKLVAQYRNGKGRGRNYSTLDDGITQTALRFLAQCDRALNFKDKEIHTTAGAALDALLKAQYPNGAFPQVWSGPVPSQTVTQAVYPDYDWRTENRIKDYWDLYTLNDGVCGNVADTLIATADIYDDERCRKALAKLGDFLLLAQMPEPQPAWAQQYDYQMRPVWARKFEPPAIAGRESEDAIETLMKVYRRTGDKKYLAPIPRALEYLASSVLPDGKLARYYELKTNKPLYMNARYELTHDDSDVPDHYGWKNPARVDELKRQYEQLGSGTQPTASKPTADGVRAIIEELDAEGRWVSNYSGEGLVGQPKFAKGDRYLSSAVFSRNLERLSEYVAK
jgi:hypothetical protein